MKCRHCSKELVHKFLDLGFSPPSNAYLSIDDLTKPEKYYPLRVMVCDKCWLVQTEDYAQANELFDSEYAYFSSTSSSWLKHAETFVKQAISEFSLSESSLVIEVASNDGYLLRNFVEKKIPCLGIEPTKSTADKARALGIEVIEDFFTEKLSQSLNNQGLQSDLIIGNNVYAHVPDVNDFTKGLKRLLKPGGTIVLEFPHLKKLIEFNQFDTIYHEHFSYFSLYTVIQIFKSSGLKIWNVEKLKTHGGSLRVYGCHLDECRDVAENVGKILDEERDFGLIKIETYENFQGKAELIKNNFIEFLIEKKKSGKKVAAYGAAAKGNTLLNFSGIKSDLLEYICDAATSKQNKYTPGSHIPIYDVSFFSKRPVDFVIVLPWNLIDEIKPDFQCKFNVKAQLVTFIPDIIYH